MKALLTSPTACVIPTTDDRLVYRKLYQAGWIYEITGEDEEGETGYIFPSSLHRWY